jgi:hypothetical protein
MRVFSVVENAQIVKFEVVHGEAVEVGDVKGETDLVDRYVEGIEIGFSCGSVRRLRRCNGQNAGREERYSGVGVAEGDGAFAPMTGHGEQV